MSTANTRHTLHQFPAPSAQPLEEKIRRRAYELFLGRGAQHGRDLEDWLQAETELVRQTVASPGASTGRKPRLNARKK